MGGITLHLTDEDTEAWESQSLVHSHTACKQVSYDLNLTQIGSQTPHACFLRGPQSCEGQGRGNMIKDD